MVEGEYAVVVESLKDALEGVLPAIDVTAFANEEGAYKGRIWLAVQFDIAMDELNYVNPGRGVNVYRWLPEEKQTTAVLGSEVAYAETREYEQNVAYYDVYRGFEKLTK